MVVAFYWLFSISLIFRSSVFGQPPAAGAGIFGQLTLPDYGQRPRPLPYANTLWPFPPAYSDNSMGNGLSYFGGGGQQPRQQYLYQPSPYGISSPYQQPAYVQQPQQLQQQTVSLDDLIAELSIALVRSFAQILAENRQVGGGGGGGGGTLGFPAGTGGIRPVMGGQQQQPRGNNLFGIPFAQPPQPPVSPYGGRTTTNYGYGVNAGVFAGTYGGSDSIASPYGPYGPTNSQIGGGPYSGLSSWPYIPGRPSIPLPPTPSPSNNGSLPAAPSGDGGGQPQQPPAPLIPIQEVQPPAPVVGEGSVVQIPLTENVQGEGAGGGVEGSGVGELPIPPEAEATA